MNIILATNNMDKKDELEHILSSHKLYIPEDFGIVFNFEENGSTFFENAYGKAEALRRGLELALPHDQLKLYAVLADDSGLVVPSLGGAPGIYSARFGSDVFGRELAADERNAYLLEQMKEKKADNRKAFFVCSMVVLLNAYRMYSVQETLEGVIAEKETGENGFGYDPLLYIPELDKTAAQLDPENKNAISHRGKAAKALGQILP
jgi:XTP/dITP diphosphohydrolase